MATIELNGQQVEFKPGESVIAAAARHQVEIPHYCWHKHLSVAANCRMCLVEVEGAPKLQPACQTPCKEGMVVRSETPQVKAAQEAVSELLLINHPIDCPICDQAGECKLQDYYMKYQLSSSRMRDQKVGKRKLQRLGPNIMYNAERCIMCTRCVRFMEEVAGSRILGVFNRGDHAEIGTAPGQSLDHPYALNTVDVCPVGALTSTRFRFRQRVWNLQRAPSLCGGCARGCNIHADFRAQQVYRFLPRENSAVNATWLCDEGRLSFEQLNVERLWQPGGARLAAASQGAQLASPSVADGEGVVLHFTQQTTTASEEEMAAAGVAQALELACDTLRSTPASQIGVIVSLHATVEETAALACFAKQLEQTEVGLLSYSDGDKDALLRLADKNPNRAGVMAVLKGCGLQARPAAELLKAHSGSKTVWLIVGQEGDLDALGDLSQLGEIIHLGWQRSKLSDSAALVLPTLPWLQKAGTWINGEARAQRLRPAFAPQGAARSTLLWLSDLAALLDKPLPAAALEDWQAYLRSTIPTFAALPLADLPAEGLDLPAPAAA